MHSRGALHIVHAAGSVAPLRPRGIRGAAGLTPWPAPPFLDLDAARGILLLPLGCAVVYALAWWLL